MAGRGRPCNGTFPVKIERVLEPNAIARCAAKPANWIATMSVGDFIYVLFLAIVCWLALNIDDSGGGGKRSRIPAAG